MAAVLEPGITLDFPFIDMTKAQVMDLVCSWQKAETTLHLARFTPVCTHGAGDPRGGAGGRRFLRHILVHEGQLAALWHVQAVQGSEAGFYRCRLPGAAGLLPSCIAATQPPP